MLFWNKICGFTAIFFLCPFFSNGQVLYTIKPAGTEILKKSVSKAVPGLIKANKEQLNLPRSFAVIPQNYYTQHLGFMCKKEWAIEKTSKIPFKFRLGSLQQCNYLEGKR